MNQSKMTRLFLGLTNTNYMKTFPGIIHGIGSILALILGNYIFLKRVVLGNETRSYVHYNSYVYSDFRSCSKIFHLCNFSASMITALYFWNKVQSWQLSTTTMKEKGLKPKTLQRFNQGRGVVTMILFSMFPLLMHYCPEYYLRNVLFCKLFSLLLITGSTYVYNLIKDYGRFLFVFYGLTPMALGISILTAGRKGTILSFNESYPLVLDRIEKESSFVISCVQMGFMLYYLYSRDLVTKCTVQKNLQDLSCTNANLIHLMCGKRFRG